VNVAVRPIQASSGEHATHDPPSATGDRVDAAFEDGEYRVRYTFPAPGVWEVRAIAKGAGHENGIVVTATPQVEESATAHHTTVAVLAVAGMAVMMLVKWIVF